MIKIHIDNIKNEDGKVWAVQDGKKYHRVHGVMVEGVKLQTRVQRKQPRAFLTGKGKVEILTIGLTKIAIVTG
jgi:hypothetical protein